MKLFKLALLYSLAVLMLGSACSPTSTVGTVNAPDGTAIRYEDHGKGDVALVFVHCWGCNRGYWKNQVKHYARKYRVITLDLGGHGESGKNRGEWKVLDLAQDVEAVMDHLHVKKAILVGHSMGGPIALGVAKNRPEQVIGVVCVDTLQNVDQKFPKPMFDATAAKLEMDLPNSMAAFMPMMFGKDSDPKMVDWVLQQEIKNDPKVVAGLMRNMTEIDYPALMSGVKVPIRCVNAEISPPMGMRTAPDVNKKYADFEVIEIKNVGHFPHLEKTDEFNQKMDQALDSVLKGVKTGP